MGRRLVERLEVFVVKARSLTQLAIPGFQGFGGPEVLDDGIDTSANLAHLLVVGLLVSPSKVLGAKRCARIPDLGDNAIANPLRDIGPTVLDQVLIGETPGLQDREIHEPLLLR